MNQAIRRVSSDPSRAVFLLLSGGMSPSKRLQQTSLESWFGCQWVTPKHWTPVHIPSPHYTCSAGSLSILCIQTCFPSSCTSGWIRHLPADFNPNRSTSQYQTTTEVGSPLILMGGTDSSSFPFQGHVGVTIPQTLTDDHRTTASVTFTVKDCSWHGTTWTAAVCHLQRVWFHFGQTAWKAYSSYAIQYNQPGKDLRSAVSQPAHHSCIRGEDLLQPNVIADQTIDLCNSKDHRQHCIAQVQEVLETCKGCPASKAPLYNKEIIMLWTQELPAWSPTGQYGTKCWRAMVTGFSMQHQLMLAPQDPHQ